jgi:hypothetical protein
VKLAQLEQQACADLAACQRHLFRRFLPCPTFQQVAELPGFSEALGDMPVTSSCALAMREALLGWPSNMWCGAGLAGQPAQLPSRHGPVLSAAKQPLFPWLYVRLNQPPTCCLACCSLEEVVGGEADGSFDRKVLACAGAGLGIIPTVDNLNQQYGVFIKPTDPDTVLSLATRQRR